jgi:NAD(P)H-binding
LHTLNKTEEKIKAIVIGDDIENFEQCDLLLMKHILLFGATGRTGIQVLKYALDKGYRVTALVRNPEKITEESDRLTISKGLPSNINDVRKAMLNCDRVGHGHDLPRLSI